MITWSTCRSVSRAALVSIRYSDSGVVMRMSGGRRAIWRRSSAGVSPVRDIDPDVRARLAETFGGEPDARQRRPQVALDVVGERLERRDVQDADVAGFRPRGLGAGIAGKAVQAPQERGEGLATPRRGVDQRVATGRDGGPAAGLGVRRRLEARREPGTDRRARTVRAGHAGLGLGRLDGRGHGTVSIGRPTPIEHPCCCTRVAEPASFPLPAAPADPRCLLRASEICTSRPIACTESPLRAHTQRRS